MISHEIYETGRDGFMTMLNVTDGSNRLLAGHGANYPEPRWATEAFRERFLREARHKDAIGQVAPGFDLPFLNGDARLTSQDLRGQPALIHVWRPEAESQIRGLDIIERMLPKLRALKLTVVSLCFGETDEHLRKLAAEQGYTHTILYGSDYDRVRLPMFYRRYRTLLLDRDGVVRSLWGGEPGRAWKGESAFTEADIWAALNDVR